MIRSRIVALTSIYLLVVCAVGMLHPVRNALVLGALGGKGFYKVYLASALVAVAVVPFGRLAAHIPQRRLTPAVAGFFAINLVLFRALYPGGVVFGVLFYAWHDLYAGILISQFFLATQELLDPRSAKTTYPWIVGAGSVGAAIGGVVTGFMAPTIGVANLLLIAAALTVAFAIAMLAASGTTKPAVEPFVRVHDEPERLPIRDLLANRQVQLIAATVVITVLVKQLVDYQFNAASATLGDREAISAFQGKFNAGTQWLPLVAAAAIRPALARWGVGAALLMLPVGMIVTNLIVALRGGLVSAAVAKGTETTLRYSAERTGREILYIPVPDTIRARAKPLIDVGLESGLAKALSAAVIFVLLATVGAARLAWPTIVLAVVWLGTAIAERRAYVRALAGALRIRSTGLAALAATLSDPITRRVVRRTLAEGDAVRVGFALDLLAYAPTSETSALEAELHALQTHADASVRERAAAIEAMATGARVILPSGYHASDDTTSDPSTLASTLLDEQRDLRARRIAARSLRQSGGPEAAAALLGAAADSAIELGLRTDALHALRRLRDDEPGTPVEQRRVHDVVTEHLDAAARYTSVGVSLRAVESDERQRLLRDALVEAWQMRQTAVFDGLGVIYEPRLVDGCYRAVTGVDERYRAEALELIEESVSRQDMRRLDPILRASPDDSAPAAAGLRADMVTALVTDDDPWVAQCAAYSGNNGGGYETMQVIERVFLLQRVDVFSTTPSHHLARIALLASEVEAAAGAVLLKRTEIADAMYVVIDGELRAEGPERSSRLMRPGEAVGALAVFDDAPLGLEVRVTRASRLLHLTRRDLQDLLHDHPDLAVSLLQGMTKRLRLLIEARPALVPPTSRPTLVLPSDRGLEQRGPGP